MSLLEMRLGGGGWGTDGQQEEAWASPPWEPPSQSRKVWNSQMKSSLGQVSSLSPKGEMVSCQEATAQEQGPAGVPKESKPLLELWAVKVRGGHRVPQPATGAQNSATGLRPVS
jgi:hypothetical protein